MLMVTDPKRIRVAVVAILVFLAVIAEPLAARRSRGSRHGSSRGGRRSSQMQRSTSGSTQRASRRSGNITNRHTRRRANRGGAVITRNRLRNRGSISTRKMHRSSRRRHAGRNDRTTIGIARSEKPGGRTTIGIARSERIGNRTTIRRSRTGTSRTNRRGRVGGTRLHAGTSAPSIVSSSTRVARRSRGEVGHRRGRHNRSGINVGLNFGNNRRGHRSRSYRRPHRRIFNHVVWPRYRHFVHYSYGPYSRFNYVYPYYQ